MARSTSRDEQSVNHLALVVAESVRGLRRSRGETLDEVAARAGLSRAFVGQIETASANPTLASLTYLAGALGSDPFSLLRPGPTPVGQFEPVLRRARAVGRWPAHSGRTYELSAPEASAFAAQLTDGAPIDHDQLLGHDGEEFCMVLDGSYDVYIGQDEFRLGPGDSLHYAASRPHRITPVPEGGRILVIFGPVP
ncbi:MAG TPA: XRE family transcriptional regulator [Acidimicrobiales bacterium]|jgi:transcriptional regulator with XRE-family HTH domain|nr:XRE family transcriptional regulator [Acidimicrobiales bacterium]